MLREYHHVTIIYIYNEIRELNIELRRIIESLRNNTTESQYEKMNSTQVLRNTIKRRTQTGIENKWKIKLILRTIYLPNPNVNYINLSKIQLTENQKEFPCLKINCHFSKKYDLNFKKIEIENTLATNIRRKK